MDMVIGLVIAGAVGWFVRADAKRHEADGRKVGPFGADGWFFGVFLLMIVFLPWYLIQRSRASTQPLGQPGPMWMPDPNDESRYRWWDGDRWTEDTAPRHAPSSDEPTSEAGA